MQTLTIEVTDERLEGDRRAYIRWTPEDFEKFIFSLHNTSSPNLDAESIVSGLSRIRNTYGDDEVHGVLRQLYEEDEGSISNTRKSSIFGLAHSLMYQNTEPSVLLLLAFHFALQSGDAHMISATKAWIRGELSEEGQKLLISVFGNDLVESDILSRNHLNLIQAELRFSEQVQGVLDFDSPATDDTVH